MRVPLRTFHEGGLEGVDRAAAGEAREPYVGCREADACCGHEDGWEGGGAVPLHEDYAAFGWWAGGEVGRDGDLNFC